MAGEPLRVVAAGGLAAIVGSIGRSPDATPRALARYDAVVRQLAERFPAVLPARFGTCVSREELASILAARADSLSRALRHVRGRAQMTVRVIADQGSGIEEHRSHATGALSGTTYLRQRAAADARAREVVAFEPLRSAVKRWIRDERVEKRDRTATIYHLVPRASAAAYTRSLRGAALRAGTPIVVSGPWPPYAFTET
jgi:hypothetical protein